MRLDYRVDAVCPVDGPAVLTGIVTVEGEDPDPADIRDAVEADIERAHGRSFHVVKITTKLAA